MSTIDYPTATVFYLALGKAIAATEELLKRKSAAMFADALALELSAYKAEREKLAKAFPKLETPNG